MHAPLLSTSLRLALLAGAVLAPPRAATAATDHARFGERVAVAANLLVVGAPEQDGSGRIYVFAHDSGAWRLRQRIEPDQPCGGCAFGASVAVDGVRLAVGEPGSGSVFVFRHEQGVWRREARLRDEQNPALGAAVAISGDSVVAGSADGRPATVFVRDVEAVEPRWSVQARLAPGGEHAQFGSALAIEGDLVVVGDPAPRLSGGGRGTLHVFERDDEAWGQAELLAQGDAAGDGFGRTLALLGDTLIAGAEVARRVHVYTRDGARWSRTATLQPVSSGDSQFGAAVGLSAISGSDRLQAIVGAPLAANATRRGAGLAQLHRGRGENWDAGVVLQPVDERDAHAGWDVAVADALAVIGIPDLDRSGVDRGAVAAYLASGDQWPQPTVLAGDAALPDDAPVIGDIAALAFNEGQEGSLRIPLDDADTPLDELSVVVHSTDAGVLDDSRIAVRAALGGRRVELDPETDAHGAFALMVLAGDGRSVATRRVPVTIRAVNDAPTFVLGSDPMFGPRPGAGTHALQDFVRGFDPGPRESGQTIVAGSLQEASDPAGVVEDAALIPSIDGRSMHLSLRLSGRAGTAHLDLRIRDSGGTANGGQDWSAERRFAVTVLADPAALFFDGFE